MKNLTFAVNLVAGILLLNLSLSEPNLWIAAFQIICSILNFASASKSMADIINDK